MRIITTMYHLTAFSALSLLFCWPNIYAMAGEKIIIARNGAGEKFIEHTLPAVTFAATKDIDYIELHVVMTSDNQLIVFRDLTLNRLTDVADIFPGRSREDGSYYVIDFSLKEIRQTRLRNVLETEQPVLSLAIPTLREELGLIRRLESILSKSIGISLEIKQPLFHSEADKDISSASLDILTDYDYIDNNSKLFIQCFDPEELQRIYAQLMPERGMNLPLIQLIGNNDTTRTPQKISENLMEYSYDWLYTNSGLKIISSYAAAIGLPADTLIDSEGNLLLTDYIAASHKYGLSVFVYPLNNQTESLPPFADTFLSLLDIYLQKANIDGFYTDDFSKAGIISDRFEADKKRKTGLPDFFSSLNLSSPSNQNKEREQNKLNKN